jgi:hypothetical protein
MLHQLVATLLAWSTAASQVDLAYPTRHEKQATHGQSRDERTFHSRTFIWRCAMDSHAEDHEHGKEKSGDGVLHHDNYC